MRKLYYGGSFNPIHHAHLICARSVAETCGYDSIVLVPSGMPPHKVPNQDMASAADRLAMCQIGIADVPEFQVSDMEITQLGSDCPALRPNYTIDTIRVLNKQAQQRVSWLIGADMMSLLPKWHEAEAVIREANIIVMARPGWEIDWAAMPAPFRALQQNVVAAPLIDIAATTIRQRVRDGRSIAFMTPSGVCRYIEEHKLYR